MMKILYLDTNIIIAFLKKDDVFNTISTKLMNAKILERVGSAITILELSSIISKQFEEIEFDVKQIPDWDSLSLPAKKLLIISYFLDKLPIKFYFNSVDEGFPIGNLLYKVHIDFSKAIRISPFFPLKALDNLQIASALNLRDIKNIPIDYFITTDKSILDQAKVIQAQTNLTAIHPEKLSEIEYL
jgi:predicted nucleic acid-binding protein